MSLFFSFFKKKENQLAGDDKKQWMLTMASKMNHIPNFSHIFPTLLGIHATDQNTVDHD